MSDLTLDGNALAGLLSEMLSVDATTVRARCASCGADGVLAETEVYVQCPGTVVRCRSCGSVLMCFVHIRGHLMADLHGIGQLTI